MSSLYNNAVRQGSTLQKSLEEVRDSPENVPNRLFGEVSTAITAFQRAVDSYNGSIANETVPDKKTLAQSRVANFREQLVSAREELRSLKARREESIISQSRANLFQGSQLNQRSNIPPSSSVSENPFANPGPQGSQGIDRASGMAREGDVLARTSQSIDEFLEMGRHAFADLSDQNEVLRKTGQGMRKVANTLGVSNETIRKVEKRAKEDKFIFYGGALTMLVVFYLLIRWIK